MSEAGIHSSQLTRLVADDTLERVARGHYRLAAADVTEHHALVLASVVAPAGVISLLSALNLHAIGTQLPAEIWLAIERGSRAPRLSNLRIRVVSYSGAAFHEEVEVHTIDGQRVRVYSVAKTLADLFKARCVFRSIPITRFARSRSPISLEGDHRFRRKAIGHFAPSRSPISPDLDHVAITV